MCQLAFDFLTIQRAIKDGGYWYLATPYSGYPAGTQRAFVEASKVAAAFVRAGIPVYSPIAHTHPIAVHGGMDPLACDQWLLLDRVFEPAAVGLIVVKMPSWEKSHGISEEIKWFDGANKPIMYMDWLASEAEEIPCQ